MTTGRAKRSVKRQLIPGYGRKGMGWVKNPQKAAYNAVYHRTTVKSPLPYFGAPTAHKSKARATGAPHRAYVPVVSSSPTETIASSSMALAISSDNFEQLKQDISTIYENRITLKRQLSSAEISYYITFLFSSKDKRQARKQAIEQLKSAIAHAYIDLTFRGNMKDQNSWDETSRHFQDMMQSDKIWDLTSRQATDKFHQRTIADEAVDRKVITSRGHKTLEFVKADVDNLYLPNMNGADIYVYPTFIILFSNYKEFSIHDLEQINVSVTARPFHEEEGLPSDAVVVGNTYKFTNKNGTPDRRHANNYTIPVAQYGDLRFISNGGINERYMFSNFEKFASFSKSFIKYAKANLRVPVQS
jgi:hypothetical protein